MYAIIEDSGSQIKVRPGDEINLNTRGLDEGAGEGAGADTIQLSRVLLLSDPEEKGDAVIGTPYVDGAVVSAEVIGEVLGDKIRIFTYKRRKGYRRRMGHRQPLLRVRITHIAGASH